MSDTEWTVYEWHKKFISKFIEYESLNIKKNRISKKGGKSRGKRGKL